MTLKQEVGAVRTFLMTNDVEIERSYTNVRGLRAVLVRFLQDALAQPVSSPSARSFKFISAAVGKAHLLSWSWRQWLHLYRLWPFATGANERFCCVASIPSQCALGADGGTGAGAGIREERTCG